MAFFDQVYQQLFGKKAAEDKVLINEVISRSEKYKEDYGKRINSDEFKKLALDVYSSYELKQKSLNKEPEVHILNSQYANGFAISYNDKISTTDFLYLFDWLSERTGTLNYQVANSDLMVVEKNSVVESKEKHYLKPRVGMDEIIDQQFGNILIEHISINDRPSYIKYMASIYSDRKYQEPQKFEKLTEYLFQDLID